MGNLCATTAAIHLSANDHGAMIDVSSEQSVAGISIHRCGHYGIIIAGWLKGRRTNRTSGVLPIASVCYPEYLGAIYPD